jgi:hypothetical protein
MTDGDEQPPKKGPAEVDQGTYIRRLAALLAWLDHEHRITAELVRGEPAFYADPANLDAYAELLDANEWRTVCQADGRTFFLQLAREIQKALVTPGTEDHLARVRETKRIWDA